MTRSCFTGLPGKTGLQLGDSSSRISARDREFITTLIANHDGTILRVLNGPLSVIMEMFAHSMY
ncbi:hypothetical protein ACG98H_12010 [Corynebacterium sp. L4756]|uniref:hypothetical protein n=1 Tax=unclassified Corynebacterium TaxID=2624378 RepID=UPI00374D0DF0